MNAIEEQEKRFEGAYARSTLKTWEAYDTKDILTRYLVDRRIQLAVKYIMEITKSTPSNFNILVICGGVGGEGTQLLNLGFKTVAMSDFSESALKLCRARDSRLSTIKLNAEQMNLKKGSYDFVIVQDGLHHLPKPICGFTEMLRVAAKGVVIIEPHAGLIARLFGTVWERGEGTLNYAFRWNKLILEQVTRSYLLKLPCDIKSIQLWDHPGVMDKLARFFGGKQLSIYFVKFCYFILNTFFWWLGNMMIGIVIKETKDY